MTSKEKQIELVEKAKSENTFDVDSESIVDKSSVKNPLSELYFKEIKKINKSRAKSKSSNRYFKFWLLLLVLFLVSSSILLNSLFLEKYDPAIFKAVKTATSLLGEIYKGSRAYITDQITKPYVVTVGEYGNVAIAKDEAIKLLPELKQIDIKKLDSGMYTFEIEKLGSKKEAYMLARKFTQSGFDAVHVRYLPNQ